MIGTVNRDTVIRADGSTVAGYGGILYSLVTLSRYRSANTTIVPVLRIGRDHDPQIRDLLTKIPGVDLRCVRTVAHKNNHCTLKYSSIADKTEKLKGWVGSISREHLRVIPQSDCYLVNYISGSDIQTRNLMWLRQNVRGLIYVDFHSRTLGRSSDGSRFIRRPVDWKTTVACADFLQLNELEFELLWQTPVSEKNCTLFMQESDFGPLRALLVTLGNDGCLVTTRVDGKFQCHRVPAPRISLVKDTTGCGDIYGAGFVAAYLSCEDIVKSATMAVRTASGRVGSAEADWIQHSISMG